MKKLTGQMMIMMFARFVTLFCSMISGVVVARYFGVAIYGIYSVANVFLLTIATFFDCGFDLAFISKSAKDEKNTKYYFGDSLLIKALAICLALFASMLLPQILGYDKDIRGIILLLFISVLLPKINSTFMTLLQIQGRFKTLATMNVVRSVIYLGAALVIIFIGGSIELFCVMQSIAAIFILAIFVFLLEDKRLKFKLELIPGLFREMIGFGISSYLHVLYQRIPIMMLTYFAPASDIGFFEAANRITSSVYQSVSSIESATIPAMFKANNDKKSDVSSMFLNVINFVGFLGFFICSTFIILGDEIILFLYGSEYILAIPIFKVLSISIFALFFAPVYGSMISASGNIRKKVNLQMIVLIICIVSSVYLVKTHGSLGVALSNMFVSITILVTYLVFVHKKFQISIKNVIISLIKYTMCALISSIILVLLSKTQIHVIIKIILSGLAYVSSVVVIFYKGKIQTLKGRLFKYDKLATK